MKTVELFAGIGGFRIAAENAGLKTVWANDFCTTACAVYRDQFGDKELREGDIHQLFDEIPAHDVLTGGFPCQPFSAAGKKLGIEDPRGTLFQVIVDVLREKRPKYFVLENVKRLLTMDSGRHFATILDALANLDYCVEWRLVNALDFGLAQNRQRVFIVGALKKKDDTNVLVRLAKTEEIEGGFHEDSNSNLSDVQSWRKIVFHGARFPSWGVAKDGKFCGVNISSFADAATPVLLKDVLQPADEVDSAFDFTESMEGRLQLSVAVNRFVGGVQILSNQGGGARMGYTVFGTNGVAPTLTASQSRHYERYKVGRRYRRLTNIEYARLQGFPDGHCRTISPYNQYALFGNAVPPCMAEWAIKSVISEGKSINTAKRRYLQSELFTNV